MVTKAWTRFPLIVFLAFFHHSGVPAHAFPINTDVAIQPAEGELVIRSQVRYVHASEESGDADGELDVRQFPLSRSQNQNGPANQGWGVSALSPGNRKLADIDFTAGLHPEANGRESSFLVSARTWSITIQATLLHVGMIIHADVSLFFQGGVFLAGVAKKVLIQILVVFA